jgi:hypothetical protein
MSEIFISYRRADSQDVTARLVDELVGYFGDDAIFRDVYDILPGHDFTQVLRNSLAECPIFIPVIGQRWLSELNRRLENHRQGKTDWVHEEVETALREGKYILPVLIHGAVLPTADALPPSLRPLAGFTAFTLSDTAFEDDIKQLLRFLFAQPVGDKLLMSMLQEAFDFTLEDLAYNQKGKLSPRQKEIHNAQKWVTGIVIVFFVIFFILSVIFGFALYTLNVSAALSITASTCFVIPTGVLLIISVGMATAKIATVKGRITQGAEANIVQVDDTALELTPGQNPTKTLDLIPTKDFKVFYRKGLGVDKNILSLQPINEVTDHANAAD